MAKFKVGDKVEIVDGIYPEGYTGFRIKPGQGEVGLTGTVKNLSDSYVNEVPDYVVCFEGCQEDALVDEVHLVLVEDSQEQEPAPDLALQAIALLESINAKLDALDARLTAHEAKTSSVITINVDGAVQIAEKAAVTSLPANACEEIALPEPWLYEFDEWMQVPIGTTVEVEFPSGDIRMHIITNNHYNFCGGLPMTPGDGKPLELDDMWSNSRHMKALRVIR